MKTEEGYTRSIWGPKHFHGTWQFQTKKHDTLLSCEKFDCHMERKFLEDRQLKRKSACTGFSTKLRDQGHCRMINTQESNLLLSLLCSPTMAANLKPSKRGNFLRQTIAHSLGDTKLDCLINWIISWGFVKRKGEMSLIWPCSTKQKELQKLLIRAPLQIVCVRKYTGKKVPNLLYRNYNAQYLFLLRSMKK